MEPLRGRCLCGDVRYAASASTGRMWYCHCRACAKTSGVGFGTWMEVADVQWESDDRQRRRCVSSAELTRSFCGTCGGVLPAQRRDGSAALLPAGGLDDAQDLQPGWHDYASQRADWLPAIAALPYRPESRSQPIAASASADVQLPSRRPDSPVTGSCLCGAIAFTIDSPLSAMRVCHCSRCRRRSGSSYFVGLACASSGLRFLRGESLSRSWQLPASARYLVRFCAECGSSVPSVIGTRAFIAAGSLDADPGVRTRCHIYFASRASWTVPQDDLPRFEELPPQDFDWSASGATPSTTIQEDRA